MSKPLAIGMLTILLTAAVLVFLYGLMPTPPPSIGGKQKGVTNVAGTAIPVLRDDQKISIVTAAESGDMDSLRSFVGSVHHWHAGFPIIIYAKDLNRTEMLEARNWVSVEVVSMWDIIKDKDIAIEDFVPIALHDAVELHGAALYLPPRTYLNRPLSRPIQHLWEHGFILGQKLTGSTCGLTGCCIPNIIGFVDNSTAFQTALLPTALCAIEGSCRGKTEEVILRRLRRAVLSGWFGDRYGAFNGTLQDTDSEEDDAEPLDQSATNRPCMCYDEGLSTMLREADRTNPDARAREFINHLLERDASLVHRLHFKPKKPDTLPGDHADHDHSGDPDYDEPVDTHRHDHEDEGKVSVCLIVPSTTRGKDGEKVDSGPADLPLFNVLIKSFLETAHAEYSSGKYAFSLYLGIDIGDPIYDNPDEMARVTAMFAELTADVHMHLIVKKFGPENRGAPAWFWNGLFEAGYNDGCEYFYQVNDDILLMTSGWTEQFVHALSSNPRLSNLGMAGPQDVGNQKTMTQTFAHRTHYDIFGFYYPRSLKNWYSDDWASHIYDDVQSSFWIREQQIRNQNAKGTRYHECGSCEGLYRQELANGRTVLNQWLANHPRP